MYLQTCMLISMSCALHRGDFWRPKQSLALSFASFEINYLSAYGKPAIGANQPPNPR